MKSRFHKEECSISSVVFFFVPFCNVMKDTILQIHLPMDFIVYAFIKVSKI